MPGLRSHGGHVDGNHAIGRDIARLVSIFNAAPILSTHTAEIETQVLAGRRHPCSICDVSTDIIVETFLNEPGFPIQDGCPVFIGFVA